MSPQDQTTIRHIQSRPCICQDSKNYVSSTLYLKTLQKKRQAEIRALQTINDLKQEIASQNKLLELIKEINGNQADKIAELTRQLVESRGQVKRLQALLQGV